MIFEALVLVSFMNFAFVIRKVEFHNISTILGALNHLLDLLFIHPNKLAIPSDDDALNVGHHFILPSLISVRPNCFVVFTKSIPNDLFFAHIAK